MLRLFDRIFEFCASLKLAIVLILSLSFFLAIGTLYESRYGAQAANFMVYGSTAFLLLMAMLSINVLAAAMSRFPWKRRQTGFVITHLGIEILLGGCLWSYRSSIDGHLALRPGEPPVSTIDLNDEVIHLTYAANGSASTWTAPVRLWEQAGFPTIPKLLAGMIAAPPHLRWHESARPTHIADGVDIQVLDWLPAAKFERKCIPAPGHPPAVEIRIAGKNPMGMPVDEHAWLHPVDAIGTVSELFDGVIEASFWQASSRQEADEFLHPPDSKSLNPMGRLELILPGDTPPIKIDVAEALATQQPADNNGYKLKVDEYFPQAILQDDRLIKSGEEPTDPQVHLRLTAPGGAVWEYNVSSKYPFLTKAFALGDKHQPNEVTPVILYDTPQSLATDRQQRGRLQLLQTIDGKLLARRVGLSGLEAFEVKIGEAQAGWAGMNLTIEQYVPAADLLDTYRPLRVSANQMDTSMRAIRLALKIDGRSTETWIARGAGPTTLDTPRGPAILSYDFATYSVPVSLSLISATRETDPGSTTAAAVSSIVSVQSPAGNNVESITMNHPLSAEGYTFYQSDQRVTMLSVRKDPGWPMKYTGCGLIVFGIFLMFYMKAYFQKPTSATNPAHALEHAAQAAA